MTEHNNLKYTIENCGMSVDKICELSGVTKANMTKYMDGKACPNVKIALKIASVLGVKVEDLW